MKKIFVLLLVFSITVFAQQKNYILMDYHHGDFYSGKGNFTRNINKAMKLSYKVAADTLIKISKTLLGDPNDEYNGSAPIQIEFIKSSENILDDQGSIDMGFVQELINEMLSEAESSKHNDNRRIKDFWKGYEKALDDIHFRIGLGEINWDELKKVAKRAIDDAYKQIR